MTDTSWLDQAIAQAIKDADNPKEKAADPLREGLRFRLESLVEQPLPLGLMAILAELQAKGYHLNYETRYQFSGPDNPLAVGLTDTRFLLHGQTVSWCTITRPCTVWADPHQMNFKGNRLVLAVTVIPVDSETSLFRVNVNGQTFESLDPADFDLDNIRRLIAKNITANQLIPPE
jgi:hypothetical protein